MTKAEKERLELEFARKQYDTIPTEEMCQKVRELEETLDRKLDIWDNEDTYNKFQRINKLNLSDKRLLLVFSILGGSIARTATYFKVNRRTIITNIERIKKEELKLETL